MDGQPTPRRLLVVSLHFPPPNTSGSIRVGILAKYLGARGWEVRVVTATGQRGQHGNVRVTRVPYFSAVELIGTLKRRLGRAKRRARQTPREAVGSAEPDIAPARRGSIFRSLLMMPWFHGEWIPAAAVVVWWTVRRWRPDIVLSTCYPFCPHLVAYLGASRSAPWVADFGDLWAIHPDASEMFDNRQQGWARRLEAKVVRRASALTTVSEPLAIALRDAYGIRTESVVIGFDPEHFIDVEGEVEQATFRIVHAGNIWPRRAELLRLFLVGLKHAIESLEPNSRRAIRLDLYGMASHESIDDVERLGLGPVVCFNGWLPREEVLRKEKQAQVLLTLTWTGEYARGTYTSKVFEYLGARRPILAVGAKDSVVEDLFARTRAGVYCSTPEEVATALRSHLLEWTRSGCVEWRGRDDAVNEYGAARVAERFERLFDEVIARL